MRILILGAKGMLGGDLMEEFSEYDVIGWDKSDLDITSPREINKKILKLRPDVIINSAAYTNVDGAENNYKLAIKINGEAVGHLAKVARKIKARFVQISTDYVFNGQSKVGYEEDYKDRSPLNVYGVSKLLGENLVEREIKDGLDGFIIRTSYLFGKQKENLVDKIMKRVMNEKSLAVVHDQKGTLSCSEDLSKRIKMILKENFVSGIYHITNNDSFSCYELAKEISKILNKNIAIRKMSYQEYASKTKRPLNSVLLNTKLPKMRNWQEALKEYIEKNGISKNKI